MQPLLAFSHLNSVLRLFVGDSQSLRTTLGSLSEDPFRTEELNKPYLLKLQ